MCKITSPVLLYKKHTHDQRPRRDSLIKSKVKISCHYSVPNIMSSCSVQTALSRLSCPDCPVPASLSLLFCPLCHVLSMYAISTVLSSSPLPAVLSLMSRVSCLSCSVQAVLSRRFCPGGPPRLSYPVIALRLRCPSLWHHTCILLNLEATGLADVQLFC